MLIPQPESLSPREKDHRADADETRPKFSPLWSGVLCLHSLESHSGAAGRETTVHSHRA